MSGSVTHWGCVAASGTGNTAWVDGRMDYHLRSANSVAQSFKKLKLKRVWLLQQECSNEPLGMQADTFGMALSQLN